MNVFKKMSFLLLLCVVFPFVSDAKVFENKTGRFAVLIQDPNYDKDGNLKPNFGRVDLYVMTITNLQDGSIRMIKYQRPESDTNLYVMSVTGEDTLPVEGNYELVVRTVQVNNDVMYAHPPVVTHTIIYKKPIPPTPVPTDTPTPVPTDTPVPPTETPTDTPIPPTPTATPVIIPQPLADEDFLKFIDLPNGNETSFNNISIKGINKGKVLKKKNK